MSEAGHAQPSVASAPFRHLSAADTWDLLLELEADSGQLLLLDLRDGPSFSRSHLEGAERFDQTRLPSLLQDTPKSAHVVVYCYHGHASQALAGLFASSGFTNAFSVDGGFEALAREHLQRSSEGQLAERKPATGTQRFIVGDCVYAREAIQNDGGVPDLASDALLAAPGTRGVVVQVGHTEAEPQQTLYAVRFEDAAGSLGPVVGCLPEELLPVDEPRSAAT